MFDYGNEVGKQLAWVLADRAVIKPGSVLRTAEGEIIKGIYGKLTVFEAHYQELYAAHEGLQEC